MSVTWELWTVNELEILSNNKDLSIPELCKLLPNRTYNAIVNKRAKTNISRPECHYLDIEDKLVIKCREEGYTYKYIADLLNTLSCNKRRGCIRTPGAARLRYERYLKPS